MSGAVPIFSTDFKKDALLERLKIPFLKTQMMEQETKLKIWNTLNKFRGHFYVTDTKLLELISETHGQQCLDQILSNEKLLHVLANRYYLTPPTYIINFIIELANTINPKTQLDPWATLSSIIIQGKSNNGTAIFENEQEAELIKIICPDNKSNVILGDSLTEIDKLKKSFEFISCFPPFGMRKEAIIINGHRTTTNFGSMLLLKAASLLTENGIGVFLLPSSFLFDNTVKENIKALEISVVALFSIPSGAFSPLTSISSNLVVFSRKSTNRTFVAEISNNDKANKIVLDNYKNRRRGKATQLGALVDFGTFTSLQSLVLEKEIQEMAKRIGFPQILLSDISIEINALKTDKQEEVNHLPNSIYFPKVGNSPILTSPSDLKIKSKNYYQIQLNNEKANAIYVANYFNSPIGKKLREIMRLGSVIMQIPKSQLSNITLHLPDINIQSDIIEVDSKIEQFSFRIEELKKNLWKQPRNYKTIKKNLKSINQKEKLEYWIDILPSPISSILWHYYAAKENNKKVEHLLHFFEALSEFFSMLMLSALVKDIEFYKQECHKWIDTDIKFKDWYLKANFGGWNNLTSKLSKATREYLSDEKTKDFCKKIYGNPTDAFLNMLTNKGILNILIEIAGLRNQWKGHGGITNDDINKQRVVKLEQQLNELRKFISDGFEDTRMIAIPLKGEYEEGIFTFTGRELVGAKSPFREIEIKTIIPLDKKKLYLAHTNQNNPVELLPFIKYIEKSDACYFYNCIENSNVRWVSYHFDKEPEFKQPVDKEIIKAFEFLNPQ